MSSYSSYLDYRFLKYALLFDPDNDITEIEVSTSQTHHCLTFPRMDIIYSATFLDTLMHLLRLLGPSRRNSLLQRGKPSSWVFKKSTPTLNLLLALGEHDS
jgi:hypothetical protein